MTGRVFVALRVGVPIERAFELFTRHVGDWWQDDGLFRIHPHGEAKPAFEDGTLVARLDGASTVPTDPERPAQERYELGRVTIWEPPERLGFRWHQPDFPAQLQTEVEVRFEAVERNVTRVSVEHRGFTAVPADSAARHGFPDWALQQRLAGWWQSQLVALRRHSLMQKSTD